MNSAEFVIVTLIGFLAAILLLAVIANRRKHRSRLDRKISCPEDYGDAMRRLEKVLEMLEKRFLSAALTAKMSERGVPFPIRDKVWKSYPCEHGDPVAGIAEIAQLANLKCEQLYVLLPRWYEKKGIIPSGGLDSEKIRSYLHDAASVRVDAVLKDFV